MTVEFSDSRPIHLLNEDFADASGSFEYDSSRKGKA